MERATILKLTGAVLAVAVYALAGTVLAGSGVEGEIKMVGGLLLGWLGLRQPGQSK